MLRKKDLQAIKEVVEEVVKKEIAESEERTKVHVAEKIAESEKKFDDKLTESENLILQHIEDTRKILEKDIKRVENNMEEITQYYKIKKLEDDSTSYLVMKVRELDERVEKMEKIS